MPGKFYLHDFVYLAKSQYSKIPEDLGTGYNGIWIVRRVTPASESRSGKEEYIFYLKSNPVIEFGPLTAEFVFFYGQQGSKRGEPSHPITTTRALRFALDAEFMSYFSNRSDIPFPTMDERPPREDQTPSPDVEIKGPVSSHAPDTPAPSAITTASSSKLTSSDKLTALPTSIPIYSPSPRSSGTPHPSAALDSLKRSYRGSLDTALSPDGVGSRRGGGSTSHMDPMYRIPSTSASPETGRLAGVLSKFVADNRRRSDTPDTLTGKDTPKKVSFHGGHYVVPPPLPSVGPTLSKLGHSSDPGHRPPSSLNAAEMVRSSLDNPRPRPGPDGLPGLDSRSVSQSRSRATSPFRIFQNFSTNIQRSLRPNVEEEEPFIPINPFRLPESITFCCGGGAQSPSDDPTDIELGQFQGNSFLSSTATTSSGAYDCDDLIPITSLRALGRDVRIVFLDIIPRQLYLHFLLRLPAMYFSRVARIFQEAEVSRPDIQRMIETAGGCCSPDRDEACHPTLAESIRQERQQQQQQRRSTGLGGPPKAQTRRQSSPSPRPSRHRPHARSSTVERSVPPGGRASSPSANSMLHLPFPYPDDWLPPADVVSPALLRFRHSWEVFIESLLREWKTLNLVSALLASAIMTIFQVPEAADDPVTRTAALLSLICALMSLTYGCMYIVRFSTMKSMFHASRWAEEARKTNTAIWWNVWVLLATPAVWMSWSMILFLTAIMSFVWRTGSEQDPSDRPPLSTKASLGPRIAISTVLAIGLIYLIMIVRTLKTYGSHGDAATRAILRGGLRPGRHSRSGTTSGVDLVNANERGRGRRGNGQGGTRSPSMVESEGKISVYPATSVGDAYEQYVAENLALGEQKRGRGSQRGVARGQKAVRGVASMGDVSATLDLEGRRESAGYPYAQ